MNRLIFRDNAKAGAAIKERNYSPLGDSKQHGCFTAIRRGFFMEFARKTPICNLSNWARAKNPSVFSKLNKEVIYTTMKNIVYELHLYPCTSYY